MISVGETLRRERVRRNLDLDQISHELKISAKFLDAIENEQFDKLPARIFAKSFVRQYAQLLELDEDELGDQVQRQLQPPPVNPHPVGAPAPDRSLPEIQLPPVERWDGGSAGAGQRFSWSSALPALALFVVILLVCSGIYSLWQRTRHGVSAQNTPPPPAATRVEPAPKIAEAPAAQPPAEIPAPAENPPPTDRQAPAPAAKRPAITSPARPPSAERASERAPEAAPGGGSSQSAIIRATNSPNPSVRVEVTAAEPVWVLAQNDGKYLFSGTLEPNQTRTIEASGTVTLRLGNAGGVNILLNGKPLGAMGPRGQVRTVQFTSGGFHIVPAPKSSEPLDDMF